MDKNPPGVMIYIGIDPGLSGGIAFLDVAGRVVHTAKMPTTERDLLDMLHEGFVVGRCEQLPRRPCFAIIERVSAWPGMGAVSAFTFGKGFGALLMALTAASIPFDVVGPKVWQRVVGVLYPKDATQTEKKNIGKRRAQQLFPQISVTHAIADALLIAESGRRSQLGLGPGGYAVSETRIQHAEKEGHPDQEGRKAEGPISSRRSSGQARDERQRPAAQSAEAAPAGHSRHGARAPHRPGRVL